MHPDQFVKFLQQRPFQPFRITLSNGVTYDVRHPELVMVGRSYIAIGVLPPSGTGPLIERLVTVSLIHVVQVEPLEAPVVE